MCCARVRSVLTPAWSATPNTPPVTGRLRCALPLVRIILLLPGSVVTRDKRGQCILFSIVFTLPPPATTPVFGSYPPTCHLLLLTNAISWVRGACLSIWMARFRGSHIRRERGPLSIKFLDARDGSFTDILRFHRAWKGHVGFYKNHCWEAVSGIKGPLGGHRR